MPRQVPESELRPICDLLARYPAGRSLDQIQAELPPGISTRTLSRRLVALAGSGQIHRRGEGRSTRYVHGQKPAYGLNRPAGAVREQPEPFETADGAVAITLSPIAREILAYVSRPVASRVPCGYQSRMMDRYVPDKSGYLSQALKAHLHGIGKPIETERAAGTFARDILSRFLIDLSWSSSRLEGNTYSRLDTERLIQFGEEAEGKDAKEAQMILNHKAAIELLVTDDPDEIGVNRFTVLNLHALLSDNLMADPEASGRLRRRPVEIGGSVYTPPGVPQVVEEYFTLLLAKAAQISDPFEQAFFLMVHLPYLQPFEDVNKRVSRLIANLPLVRANLCPLSFVDVPVRAYVAGTMGVYEMTRLELLRDVFVWAYERSCQRYVVIRDSVVEPDRFRMHYREALIEVIGELVRDGKRPTKDNIVAVSEQVVEPRDIPLFVDVVEREFARLTEFNIARYRIRLSQFRAWQRDLNG